jgi:predicted nucleic acid binding AN1-type Zn finger protein
MEDIGAICFECKRQDFLPFQCKFCKEQFCINHRYTDQHACGYKLNQCREVPKEKQSKKKIEDRHKCFQCKQYTLLQIRCPTCGNNFCLKHRNSLDHVCKKKQKQNKSFALCLRSLKQMFTFQ